LADGFSLFVVQNALKLQVNRIAGSARPERIPELRTPSEDR
jgi:hypothetical protein